MKNNKKQIITKRILLACLFVMSLFAAFNLGKALASVNNIIIKDAVITDKSGTTDASITSFDKNSLETNITYHNVNDYVDFKVTIKNNDSKKYTIMTISDDNTNSNIVYDYDKHENEDLNSGDELDINIKVTYKNAVNDKNGRDVNGDVKFKITFVDEDGNQEDKIIPINPKTGDNLVVYIVLASLSSIGFILLLKKKKFNKTFLVLLLMIPFATKALALTYEFVVSTEVKLYDKMLVTIDINGTKEERLIPYNTKISEPDVVTIPGYNFVGWFNGTEPADFDKAITEDTVIEGRYSIITYNITYDLAGGTVEGTNKTTYTVEDQFTLINPKLTGYNFAGWTGTNLPGLTPTVTINKGTTGDLSFTASFSEATDTKYKVNHKYQQVTGDGYDLDEEKGQGVTGSTIYPQVKPKTGFISPTVQSLYILPDGSASIDYVYNRIPCQYEADSNTNSSLTNGTYRYGTEITVSPVTIPGYTFSTWEDGSTANPRVISLTGDLSVSPSYTANTNTPYTVVHHTQKLDGTYEIRETEPKTGTTDVSVTPTPKEYTGFTIVATDTKQIAGTGDTVFDYYYTRDQHALTVTNSSDVVEGDISGNYYYQQQITLTAKTKEGYTFKKWTNGQTTNSITITMGTSDITIGPEYEINSYTINFDTQGGTPVSSIVQDYGQPIGTIEETTYDGHRFDGWFTETDGGDPIDENTIVVGNDTYYAHWTEINIICKKATVLTTATCAISSGSNGCYAAGYNDTTNSHIEYGNIIRNDNYNVGDAFDCDVDGNGYTKRFYYLRTDNDKAVLIFNNNYEGTNGISNENNFTYDVALTKLPTTTDWDNLPVTYGEYAARFITWEDLSTAAGRDDLTTKNSLKNLPFLYENIGKFTSSTGRSTVWLEAVDESGTLQGYRYHVNELRVQAGAVSGSGASSNCVRPVIEVPLDSIEDSYIVKFDAMGGTIANEYARVVKGSKIGTLPTATKTDSVLIGWYTTDQFTTQIDENTIPNGYNTYYAGFKLNADQAVYAITTYQLAENTTSQIVVLNSNDVEPLTYISNDESIATVDSDGLITGHSVGNTTVNVVGALSNTYQTVNVEVLTDTPKVTVSFDTHGGTTVPDMEIDINTSIGTMPTTTKNGYTFVGWFNNDSYDIEIKGDNEILADITLHALWMDNKAVASIDGKHFYTSLQAAVDDAPTTKTTIVILKDIELTSYVNLSSKNNNKNIVLDLNGHLIKNKNNTDTNIIASKATLEITNGTIQTNASTKGAVDVNGGSLTMNDGTITSTGGRQAIYCKGGTVTIGGTVELTANAAFDDSNKRGTVQGLEGCNLTITGGTITSTGGLAVATNSGTMTIGTKDNAYDTTNLVITGAQNGIYSTINYNLYDGLIRSSSAAAVNDETKITGVEDNSTKKTDSQDGYNRLYYEINSVTPPTDEIVEFRTTNNAMIAYYNNIDSWKNSSANFPSWSDSNKSPNWALDLTENTAMLNNFNANSCKCADNQCTSSGTVECDKPNGYYTGQSGSVSVYLSDESKNIGSQVSYANGSNGIIYNLIPGQVYYWELDSDTSINGYVRATGERRILNTGDVRNNRDLGGLPVDTDNDGTVDGHLAYGRLFRGIKLSSASSVNELVNLGVTEELDLRNASDADANKLSDVSGKKYHQIETQNYFIDPNGATQTERDYYQWTRAAVTYAMQEIVNGENVYFHCRIGTDRTGTVAYILEGLLGVPEEDRIEDYELSFFYGLVRIHRYHDEKPGSSVGTGKERFVYMHNLMATNSEIYDWYMAGSSDTVDNHPDQDLINAFRAAMIESN